MSRIEHVQDIISNFSREVKELEEDRKTAWRTVAACREELHVRSHDSATLQKELYELQEELKNVKMELEEAKGWKFFFREAIADGVKAGIWLHDTKVMTAANKTIDDLSIKLEGASEELSKQKEAVKSAKEALKFEHEWMKKILKGNEEEANSIMMAIKIYMDRIKVQQSEVKSHGCVDHVNRAKCISSLTCSNSNSSSVPFNLTTLDDEPTLKRCRQ